MELYVIVWSCIVLHGIAFPQGPSFPSLGHKQARVSQGMGGKETFVVIADLCIVLYIERRVRTSCYQLCEYKPQIRIVHGPVSLWVVVSTMCCVTRARTGTLCTSESGFSWISCILDPGFLCIVPIHCSVSLGAAGSWERQTQFECILSLSSGEACAGKILDFLEEGLHYRRRRVLWLCSISTSEVDNYG